jgi:ATP-dependent Lhr-like helicase
VPKNTKPVFAEQSPDALELFHPAVRDWFESVFTAPTRPQSAGWPAIARNESTLILAPTGTGKTLAAFLWCVNRIMFSAVPAKSARCRVVYISPIKALAVDVERNLRAPLVGIAQAAQRRGTYFHQPTISIRTGDTPAKERAQFQRHPADILITTPESLYLLLTSNARDSLRAVEVVVIDEIHAVVPTKRGSHLALSIERLEHVVDRPRQRIGLSATQRPLEEVARFLGGAEPSRHESNSGTNTATRTNGSERPASDLAEETLSEFESEACAPVYRLVTIVDAGEPKRLDLRVEVPVEDMARLAELDELPSGPASQGPVRRSIWSAIHPKLLEQIRAHRSTLIFVNNRRLAERISGAANELAGETLVRAHHGSIAVTQRKEIEDRLKLGTLRGIVATSSLELGIDMGAIDLVIQIESPHGELEVGVALLAQSVIAGLGNVFKSETCFACGINPFRRMNTLSIEELNCLVNRARTFLLANVTETSGDQIVTHTEMRRTTGRSNVEERLWVYGRRGKPCRRCGTAIESRKQGLDARTTFWCPQCQPMELAKTFPNAAAG